MTDPIVTQADLDEGRFVLPGVPCDDLDAFISEDPDLHDMMPFDTLPPFVVDQPCETCGGDRRCHGECCRPWQHKDACPDCLGRGVKLLTVQVPCEGRSTRARTTPGCELCARFPDGHIAIDDCSVRLHVTAVLPIVGQQSTRSAMIGRWVARVGNAWRIQVSDGVILTTYPEPIDLPGDPADLVGKFLIEGTVAA